jgi:hypothetical protein
MKNVFYKPWVGKKYQTEGFKGKKIMILGESHYCDEGCGDCGNSINHPNCTSFTIDVIANFLEYKSGKGVFKGWMNTFTKFGNIFFNKELDYLETKDFWDSVIFYNFVQFATPEARVAPYKKEFEKSSDAFFEILKFHMPNLVIAWGERLWNNLPTNGEDGEDIVIGDIKGKFYTYTLNETKIQLFYIYHPSSSSFNYSSHEFINRALEMV